MKGLQTDVENPAAVLYLHAPSDGRPCHVLFAGRPATPVRQGDKVRIGFCDSATPDDWSTVQWESVPEGDLIPSAEDCRRRCCTAGSA